MRGKGARSLLWQPDQEPFRLLFLPIVGYLLLYSLLAHKVNVVDGEKSLSDARLHPSASFYIFTFFPRIHTSIRHGVRSIPSCTHVYKHMDTQTKQQELRFIFPAIPVLNLLAALGLAKLYRR